MAKIDDVISTYRTKCTSLMNNAAPGSATYEIYSRLSDAFDRHKGEPGSQVISLLIDLQAAARIEALPLAPQDVHVQAAEAQRLAMQFVDDFKKDAGLTMF